MRNFPLLVIVFIYLFFFESHAQKQVYIEPIWKITSNNTYTLIGGTPSTIFSEKDDFRTSVEIAEGKDQAIILLSDINEKQCLSESLIRQATDLPEDYQTITHIFTERKKNRAGIRIFPYRYDKKENKVYRLLSANLFILESNGVQQKASKPDYATTSQLASGNWFKIGVDTTGIFKLTYNHLQTLGLSGSISSDKIRLHGYGKGMLPETVSEVRPDDLPEIPIRINDGGDGVINDDDYILFYAESPDEWTYSSSTEQLHHQDHVYADTNYYFITVGNISRTKIESQEESFPDPDLTTNVYDHLIYHEWNDQSLIESGRRFVGEEFDLVTEYDFSYDIAERITSEDIYFRTRLLAKSTSASSFTINTENASQTASITSTSTSENSNYAQSTIKSFTFSDNDEQVDIGFAYNKSTTSSIGWLDYFELNVRRKLSPIDGQLAFRDKQTMVYDVVKYQIQSTSIQEVWDVTDIHQITSMDISTSNENTLFTNYGNDLREYICFDGTSFMSPILIGQVANQNLHGLSANTEYIIITHPLFEEEAETLAQFHREYSDLNTEVIVLEEIYNEFSSGMEDISAIRDFLKMMYDNSPDDGGLQYVLLFGDGSFDYKDIVSENTNMVPTYESPNSLNPVNSFATDDFFGFLDDGEGDFDDDMIDIGIGRLPVVTQEEAQEAITKIMHYATNSTDVMGGWRNIMVFVSDDEDSNSHLQDAENLSDYVQETRPEFNIEKIYFDAYIQESTTGGERYPDATDAINTRIEQGALVVNYSGHGGEEGWAHERVLEVEDIQSWSNFDELAVFITATCEFSRFDDPTRVSAGEYVFLNPIGGAVSMFTTTRATYGNPNYSLNLSIYNHMFSTLSDGSSPRLGDILRLAKRDNFTSDNQLKFILLGDPAIRLAMPELEAQITQLNGHDLSSTQDTISALEYVSLQGAVLNESEDIYSGYTGTATVTIYDKVNTITTLANDSDSYEVDFDMQNSILYKGKADVVNGEFSLEFIVPKDIEYKYGSGRISVYVSGEWGDAQGLEENFCVGGFYDSAEEDFTGPEINLYINDTNFVDGGLVGPNPVLYATISDENGINTVGNGIGHDMVAYIDNTEDFKVLNEYYEADRNTYKTGSVTYPFFDVEAGEHTLYLKAWDVYNNSSIASLEFLVIEKDELEIQRLFNYPNPVTDYTNFVFEHNQKNKDIEIELSLYNIFGEQVYHVTQNMNTGETNKIDPITWHGESSQGSLLKKGFYIYTFKVSTEDGLTTRQSNKLLLIK